MGVEVKGAGDGVVIADRGCNDCYNRNSGWGSGWGAVGGALVGGGFGAAAVFSMRHLISCWPFLRSQQQRSN